MSLSQQIISHQVWLQRLGTQTASLSIPFVQRMRNEVREATLKFGDDARTVKKLNKMIADLDSVLEDVTGDWKSTIEKALKDISDYENKWFIHTLQDDIGKAAKVAQPSNADVWAAAKFVPLSLGTSPVGMIEMLDNWTESEKNRLVRGVQSGFVQGQTTRQIVKSVAGDGGLADISQRNVMTVVRTAVGHVSNVARQQGYESNSDIIDGYQWVSTLDSRTSATCRGFDGQVFAMGKGPLPPAHPNCRSTTIPKLSKEMDFLDFLDEGGTRAAKGADGGQQVSADTSYYEFLKNQPAWFQDEALGPTRGKIFRNAGMSPEEFRQASTDGFGRPMTLAQMAANDQRVAEYLGKPSSPSATSVNLPGSTKEEKAFMAASAPIKSAKEEAVMLPPKADSMVTVPDVTQKTSSAPSAVKLTSEQIGAVEYYKGDGFYNDNRILRNPDEFTKSEVSQAKANANRINSAIDSSKTSKDHSFYRGIRSSELYDSAESLVGGEIYNRTVQSTTYAKGMAESYAGLLGGYSADPGKSVLFKINTPKGSSALNVADLTNINSAEKEVLLKAGSKYKVIKVTDHGHYKEIEVDYVEGDGKI